MISVFTNYLSPYYEEGLLPEVDQSKTHELYDQLRIAYNQGSVGILKCARMIALFNNDEDDYDIIEAVWQSKELQEWLEWVNTKITLSIGVESYMTLGVRLRIATSMLNKLVDNNVVSVKIAARIHNNLCDNTWSENSLCIDEDLPF